MKQKNETNQVLGNIRLSMSDYIKGLAKTRATMCFSGNISAYIAHLILQDVEKNGGQEYVSNVDGIQISGSANGAKIKQKSKK